MGSILLLKDLKRHIRNKSSDCYLKIRAFKQLPLKKKKFFNKKQTKLQKPVFKFSQGRYPTFVTPDRYIQKHYTNIPKNTCEALSRISSNLITDQCVEGKNMYLTHHMKVYVSYDCINIFVCSKHLF